MPLPIAPGDLRRDAARSSLPAAHPARPCDLPVEIVAGGLTVFGAESGELPIQRLVTDGLNVRVDADRCSQLIDALLSISLDVAGSGRSRGIRGVRASGRRERRQGLGVRNRAGQTYFPKDKRVEVDFRGEVGGAPRARERPASISHASMPREQHARDGHRRANHRHGLHGLS